MSPIEGSEADRRLMGGMEGIERAFLGRGCQGASGRARGDDRGIGGSRDMLEVCVAATRTEATASLSSLHVSPYLAIHPLLLVSTCVCSCTYMHTSSACVCRVSVQAAQSCVFALTLLAPVLISSLLFRFPRRLLHSTITALSQHPSTCWRTIGLLLPSTN